MTRTPPFRITVLYRGELPRHVSELLRSVSHDAPLTVLARTVAATGSWRAELPLALAVRTQPEPLLAAIGRIDRRHESMLAALSWQLGTVLPYLRYLDHDAVNDACARLADQLVGHLGPQTVDRAVFTAIPRGGLIVLGHLAYALGLRHDQLAIGADVPPGDGTRPLVVVDDCLLSGERSSRFLDAVAAPRIVVAALASHPDLRRALVARRTEVERVLSPIDLDDHAPAQYGAEYEAWAARWRERAGPGTLWVGQPDHVCFPWHEPDVGVWDPESGVVVRGWGMLPAELCLAQRRRAAAHEAPWQVNVITDDASRIADGVVHASFDDTVVVGHVDHGHSVALEGVAASMWWALTECADEQSALDALVARFDADRVTLLTDMRAFAADLAARGLLRAEATR